MKDFSEGVRGEAQERDYQQWLQAHPNGLVLGMNRNKNGQRTVHRVNCKSIWDPDNAGKRTGKICFDDESEVAAYTAQFPGEVFNRSCPQCSVQHEFAVERTTDPLPDALDDSKFATDKFLSWGDLETGADFGASLSDLTSLAEKPAEIVDLTQRYIVEGPLGCGGMGEVVRARDTRLERPVAIKRLLGERSTNYKAQQRFLTEAKSIAALNHYNIVQIFDFGYDKSGPFIVMELVDGQSLAARLAQSALSLEESIEITVELCDALDKVHECGIIHRDIKPANILLTASGIPKLTDFGLARREATDPTRTRAGAVLGTPDFMAPEQRADATQACSFSDQWSLAATLYQMLTGETPRVIDAGLIPESIRPTILRALKSAPQARFPTCGEFAKALRAVLVEAVKPQLKGLQAGQCARCSSLNDPSRKFCESCGSRLQEPCLSCGADNGVWVAFCGDCGADIQKLLGERIADAQKLKDEVQSLRANYRHADAIARLAPLLEQRHSALADFREWAEAAQGQLVTEHEKLIRRRDHLLDLAREQSAENNRLAASKSLAQIPEPLQTDDSRQVAAKLGEEMDEAERLLQEIRSAMKGRAFERLQPTVERYLELKPGDQQVEVLCNRLRERAERNQLAVGRLLTLAQQHYDHFDDDAAQRTLKKIPNRWVDERVRVLLSRAENRSMAASQLYCEIRDAIAHKHTAKVIRLVDQYLIYRPHDSQMQELKRLRISAAARRRRSIIILGVSGTAAVLISIAWFGVRALRKPTLDGPRAQDAASLEHQQITDPHGLKEQPTASSPSSPVLTSEKSKIRSEVKPTSAIDNQQLAFTKPDDGRAVTQGSFTVWTEPALPTTGLAYRVIFEIETPPNLTQFPTSDLRGILQGSDMYKQSIPTNSRQMLPVKNGHVQFVIEVPGSPRPLKDTISVHSQILKQDLTIEITADAHLRTVRSSEAPTIMPVKKSDGSDSGDAVPGHLRDDVESIKSANESESAVHEPFVRGKVVTNSIGMKFVGVSAGTFTMGSAERQDADLRSHPIRITRPFYIGVYEVTIGEYQRVMNKTPSSLSKDSAYDGKFIGKDVTRFPVSNVSWNDAVEFCRQLSEMKNERALAHVYRLPTEAEWEYVSRAGSKAPYFFGANDSRLDQYAWCGTRTTNEPPVPVGSLKPNKFGVYDVYGNVAEWCSDWFDRYYYARSPGDDPSGPKDGATAKVVRGGSMSDRERSNSVSRLAYPPDIAQYNVGFRVLLDTPASTNNAERDSHATP